MGGDRDPLGGRLPVRAHLAHPRLGCLLDGQEDRRSDFRRAGPQSIGIPDPSTTSTVGRRDRAYLFVLVCDGEVPNPGGRPR